MIVFKRLKVGYKTIGSPVTIKSNALGKLRTSVKSIIRLRPGTYRVLVQDLQDTYSASVSKWFRIK